MIISNIGMPNIGRERETKFAVESFYRGEEVNLNKEFLKVRKYNLALQKEAHVDLIPSFDFDPYDRLLRHAFMFGAISKRFGHLDDLSGYSKTYLTVPRGANEKKAAPMVKWFNTNYHCIRPEIETDFKITRNFALDDYNLLKSLGVDSKPTLIGPLTFLNYSVNKTKKSFEKLFLELSEFYIRVISQLSDAGAKVISIEEPVLVLEDSNQKINHLKSFFKNLNLEKGNSKIVLQTYFESVDHIYKDLIKLPVDGLGLDFVSSKAQTYKAIKEHGYPDNMWLFAGVVDGRSVWRSDLTKTIDFVSELKQIVSEKYLAIGPSCSLIHLPYSVSFEPNLKKDLKENLTFAIERLKELSIIKKAINNGRETVRDELNKNQNIIKKFLEKEPSKLISLNKKINSNSIKRDTKRQVRLKIQKEKLNIPLFPTTTIGSFPQTAKLRKVRLDFKNKKISTENYREFIKKKITECIKIQEETGLDILVHGEFERPDMVEFFAEKLHGMSPIKGWVQSYGTRYVRPPVITGNIKFIKPMTKEFTVFAQSLTKKPVKGMLTGPVTMLSWSFKRTDISLKEQVFQLADALKNEVLALIDSGIKIIQIDEPALREILPLKRSKWDDCLSFAVAAFKFTASSAPPDVQIHSHVCFSEFNDIIKNLNDMDADVLSIEDSKQGGLVSQSLFNKSYEGEIGIGVYDVHSPAIPTVKEMEDIPKKVLEVVPKEKIWINPDCGLKTRSDEAYAQLKNMVSAAVHLRSSIKN